MGTRVRDVIMQLVPTRNGTRSVIEPNRISLEQVWILQHDYMLDAHCGTITTARSAMYFRGPNHHSYNKHINLISFNVRHIR